MQADTVLDFDTFIYLPANNKHIRYSSSGSVIDEERMSKLKRHQMSSLFVSPEEITKVYSYTAKVLRNLGSNATMSETERSQRLHSAVRDLVSGLFSDAATGMDGCRGIIEDCQGIVKSYISVGSKSQWYDKVLLLSGGENGTYSHAANVAAYAALFAMGVGLKSVEEIAIAGLLHDIGLAKVPVEIHKKSLSEMTPSEKEIYEKHPEFAIEIIKERKIIIPELSHKIIIQHHETFNGTGFPKGIRGGRFCEEAQVLAFADRFDELTAMIPGKPRKTPAEAARELATQAASDPAQAFIDPELMKRLISLFPAGIEQSAEVAAA
jgi:putative nucleotidyltransferase with HDIG domain